MKITKEDIVLFMKDEDEMMEGLKKDLIENAIIASLKSLDFSTLREIISLLSEREEDSRKYLFLDHFLDGRKMICDFLIYYLTMYEIGLMEKKEFLSKFALDQLLSKYPQDLIEDAIKNTVDKKFKKDPI
ncbi:MAG: hypothetical protein PHW52_02580 [Candidatus Pacebacteria bacterium]|nr:hypothetical protein [Candidatus Paceibacterota bacterium]